MEAQDFFEQSKHQMLEMATVFYAYNLGEELSADQIETLKDEAGKIFNMLRRAELNGLAASALSEVEA